MTTAEIIPMRPRAGGDAESLWAELQRAQQALITEVESGHLRDATVCRCADLWRAWHGRFVQ